MPRTIQQHVTFRVSPDRLFDTYVSTRKHSAATGAKATMSRTEMLEHARRAAATELGISVAAFDAVAPPRRTRERVVAFET